MAFTMKMREADRLRYETEIKTSLEEIKRRIGPISYSKVEELFKGTLRCSYLAGKMDGKEEILEWKENKRGGKEYAKIQDKKELLSLRSKELG